MNITEISKKQLEFVMKQDLTPEEIVAFFASDFQIRKFSDVLNRLYPGGDLEKRLIQAFGRDRTVRNWLRDCNLPANRESVFQIAFALELDEIRANELLLYVFGEGIHYRNEKELIYAFSLKNGQSYEAAKASAQAFHNRGNQHEESGEVATSTVRLAFSGVSSEEDLIDFMLAHNMDFGKKHNTAYRYFMEMLSYLKCGENDGDTVYSIENITKCYLRMGMPEERKTVNYDMFQKTIKKYWPGLRSIKAMRNRREEVSRKVLLLLYIITGGVQENDYDEIDEEYVSDADIFLKHCRQLKKCCRIAICDIWTRAIRLIFWCCIV